MSSPDHTDSYSHTRTSSPPVRTWPSTQSNTHWPRKGLLQLTWTACAGSGMSGQTITTEHDKTTICHWIKNQRVQHMHFLDNHQHSSAFIKHSPIKIVSFRPFSTIYFAVEHGRCFVTLGPPNHFLYLIFVYCVRNKITAYIFIPYIGHCGHTIHEFATSWKLFSGVRQVWWINHLSNKINTLRPRQNGRRFADDTFKRIFLNENIRISIKISLNFVPKGPINNDPALVQIMAWRRSGDKPLSESMMVSVLTHICVTRPQWVNTCERYYEYVNNVIYLV